MARLSSSPWRSVVIVAFVTACLWSWCPGRVWLQTQVLSGRTSRRHSARIRCKADGEKESPKEIVEEMKNMRRDMDALRKSPRPRNGKRVGAEVWFDVELSKPLGLRIDENDNGDQVGISEVLPGGSAWEHFKECVYEKEESKKRIWLQPGDRLMQVNGETVNTQEAAVEAISKVPEDQKVRLKVARPSRGPIQVIFPEPAKPVVVRANTRLADAATAAGHKAVICPEDFCNGRCWHQEEQTKVIYQLCVTDCTAGNLPNKVKGGGLSEGIGGVFNALTKTGAAPEPGTTWDNTEPLVLRPCPEIYDRYNNPHLGMWRYGEGQYTVFRDEDTNDLVWTEYKARGVLLPEDEDDVTNRWLVADKDQTV
eukprot:TRINITY_DN21073_c0_g1_i1.p1 TRINITY_DN21073_c0_g1~~TRINITY_DN21073_c0_g1_i1.p1  ORF type:complete len:367 (+),score=67.22 TRINITY_DN21073_c0_g1_i1:51-1151(+)